MARKLLVIANPASEKKQVHRLLRAFTAFLDQSNFRYDLGETTASRRGTATVKELLKADHTDLIIVGGDGTINEAVNGMAFDIPISVLPTGSGDDYVKNLDLGSTEQEWFETALNGKVHRVDLGSCNGRRFVNGVGVGFDGQIVADMQKRKVPFLSGHARYYYHVLHILSSYKARKFSMKVDGMDSRRDLILLTVALGTTFGGGFRLTPGARLHDGRFEVCAVGKISPLKRYLNIHRLQRGTHGVLPEVAHFHATAIDIDAGPLLEGHMDGEYIGQPPFKIRLLPKALSVRARALVA